TAPVNIHTAPVSGRVMCATIASRSSGSGVMAKYSGHSASLPPLTGGKSAISSPSLIGSSRNAYSSFTATRAGLSDGSSAGNSAASRWSSAPTGCWPSSSRVVSGTPARSRSVAKNRIVTCINQLLQNNIAGLAAALFDEADGFDAHLAVDGLGHVVDRERGNTRGG